MWKRLRLLSVLIAACCAGCDTMQRAQEAQDEIAAVARDRGAGGVCETNEPARVALDGLTLRGYVEFALTKRPDVASARLAVSNAALALVTAQADDVLMPQVTAAGGHSQSTQNKTPHFSWHQKGNGEASVMVDLLLCDFGRADAKIREAAENLVAAQRDLAETELAVFGEVCTAYFTLRCDDALLAVAVSNECQYAEHLRQAQTLFEAGEVKKLDVLKARLDLSNARLATITASNDVAIAGSEFVRTLGLEADRTSRAEVLSVAPEAFAAPARDLAPSTCDAVQALLQARETAPALTVLRARLRAASARVDYAVADLLPSISLSSGFAFSDPVWNFSWGVTAVESLFEGYRKTTAVDTAVVAMREARVKLDEAEQTLSCNLANAVATRDTATQALETARVQVNQAKENLDNVIMEYRVGEASRVDFADAASAYAEAQGVRVKAFYAGQLAEVRIIRLTGADRVEVR